MWHDTRNDKWLLTVHLAFCKKNVYIFLFNQSKVEKSSSKKKSEMSSCFLSLTDFFVQKKRKYVTLMNDFWLCTHWPFVFGNYIRHVRIFSLDHFMDVKNISSKKFSKEKLDQKSYWPLMCPAFLVFCH